MDEEEREPAVLSIQPRLKLFYNEPQDAITEKYLEVLIYSEQDLRKYCDDPVAHCKSNTSSIEAQFQEHEMQRLNRDATTEEILGNFITAILHGGEAAQYTSIFYKVWHVQFDYPEEDLETATIGHLNFTDLALDPLELGDYKLIFSVNGV